MIPAHIAQLTTEQADAFYAGETSSVEAFQKFNRAARSAWNYYDGIFNDTHKLFSARVDALIDRDVDAWSA